MRDKETQETLPFTVCHAVIIQGHCYKIAHTESYLTIPHLIRALYKANLSLVAMKHTVVQQESFASEVATIHGKEELNFVSKESGEQLLCITGTGLLARQW